LLETT
jgi:hypothetical protein